MNLDNYFNKYIMVTQVKSSCKLQSSKKMSLLGLGLRGINTTSNLHCSKSVLGMVESVLHLIKISVVSN